jgi:hypothetical protein
MSRFITIDNTTPSGERVPDLTVRSGRLPIDAYAVMMLWVQELDYTKGENLYLRTCTEFWYKQYKGIDIPGFNIATDSIPLDDFAYYNATEIQNAIDFITDDVLPSLDTFKATYGDVPLTEKWGGVSAYEEYFDEHFLRDPDIGGVIMNPDFDPDEIEGYCHHAMMTRVFTELRAVLQDSLLAGEPYYIYVH